MKTHHTVLTDMVPKSGDYPEILKEAKSILVKEQDNFVPIYFSGMNVLEMRIEKARTHGTDEDVKRAVSDATQVIDSYKNISHLVHGMKTWGSIGYPYFMELTNDLQSPGTAITIPKNADYDFEIHPKNFRLGLTGRVLQDSQRQQYDEALFIGLDLFDAYQFAQEIRPARIAACLPDGRNVIVYENNKVQTKTVTIAKQEKKQYIMSDHRRKEWRCETLVLPSSDLEVVQSDFVKQLERYDNSSILIGHNSDTFLEFLRVATTLDDHIMWKISASERNDFNSPLIDAEQFYGTYKGNPRYETLGRLHFMPHKASLWFDGSSICFDHDTGLNALNSIRDLVCDIWSIPKGGKVKGWEIVMDTARGISPTSPVHVRDDTDYMKFPVIKNPSNRVYLSIDTSADIQ